MSIEFVLSRKVPIWRFDLVGTIAREEKRSDLAPVLLWAKGRLEAGQDLDPAVLAEDLLGPGAGMVTVARRLRLICRDLRLITDDFAALTDAGREAAQTGKVLQPEKAEWSFWAAEDPLLPFPILGVAPRSAVSNGPDQKRRDEPRGRPEPLPGWAHWAQGRTATLLSDGRTARFDEIAAGAMQTLTGEELEIRWSVGEKASVRLAGTLGNGARIDQAIVVDELPDTAEVWKALLTQRRLIQSWDQSRQALKIPFRATETEDERANMRTQLKFKAPDFGRWGSFRDTAVENVPLCPDSDQSASEWARHQLVSQLEGVQTTRVYTALLDRVKTVFRDWRVDLPSREVLAQQLVKDANAAKPLRAYWSVQAAIDWKL